MTGSDGLTETAAYTERYARHLVLKEIGGAGQQKLSAARVLVIGAGGLGASLLAYLAAAGVGSISIIDDDVVSLSIYKGKYFLTMTILVFRKPSVPQSF